MSIIERTDVGGLLDRAFPPPRLAAAELEVLARLQSALDEVVEPLAAEHDAAGRYPLRSIEALKPTGILHASFPREHGGLGASHRLTLEAQVRMAVADSAVAQIVRVHEDSVRELHVGAAPAFVAELARILLEEQAIVGLAVAENGRRVDSPMTTTATPQDDGSVVFDGEKIYATGSGSPDYVLVVGFDPVAGAEDPLKGLRSALARVGSEGLVRHDDWNALGQRATSSGSVSLRQLRVPPPLSLAPTAGLLPHSGARFQASFAAELVGLGIAALRAAAPFVRERSRAWPAAEVDRATQDPTVRRLAGELTADLVAAYTAVIATGDLLDAYEAGEIDRTQLAVPIYAAKATATRAALRATSEIYTLMGTRSATGGAGFDRFWRNARTLSLHDPYEWKHSEIGRHVLEGWDPVPGLYT
jgi:alkylation response protein AidB-like acyl-CoA dehydrogenase